MARSARKRLIPNGGMMAERSGQMGTPQPSSAPVENPQEQATGMMAARAEGHQQPAQLAPQQPVTPETTQAVNVVSGREARGVNANQQVTQPTSAAIQTPAATAVASKQVQQPASVVSAQSNSAPIPYSVLQQQTQERLAREEQAKAEAARPMTYEEFFKATQPDPEYTPEQERAIANREKREKLFGALSDGILALGNVAMTGSGALNQQMTFQSPTVKERWDNFNKQHEANVQAYRAGLGQAREKDRAERARQQAHQLAMQKEARETATAQAKLQMEAQKLQLEMQKAQQEGDLNKAKLYEYQLKNHYYPLLQNSKLATDAAQRASSAASTRLANTRADKLQKDMQGDNVTINVSSTRPTMVNGTRQDWPVGATLQLSAKYWSDDNSINTLWNTIQTKLARASEQTNGKGNNLPSGTFKSAIEYFSNTPSDADGKRTRITNFLEDSGYSADAVNEVMNIINDHEASFKNAARKHTSSKDNTESDDITI